MRGAVPVRTGIVWGGCNAAGRRHNARDPYGKFCQRMFHLLKELFRSKERHERDDRERLPRALAALLYDVTRMDFEVRPEDIAAARTALVDLLGLSDAAADDLLAHAGDPGNRLTSYRDAIAVVNRLFDMEHRIRLVEHLWRVAHADDELHQYEDHLVRKLSDLLHVSNTQSMLARQRARSR